MLSSLSGSDGTAQDMFLTSKRTQQATAQAGGCRERHRWRSLTRPCLNLLDSRRGCGTLMMASTLSASGPPCWRVAVDEMVHGGCKLRSHNEQQIDPLKEWTTKDPVLPTHFWIRRYSFRSAAWVLCGM